jgi:hypothetical protein
MAGTEGWSRIVYRKDDRGVILDSVVVGADDDVPEGFEESAGYESQEWTTKEAAPVDESKLTVSENQVDLRQTVDVIKADAEVQEGPTDPGAQSDDDYELGEVKDGSDGLKPGDEVVADDGSSQFDASQTVDEVKDEADAQEGPTDPRGEESEKDDPDGDEKKSARRSSKRS